MSQQPIVGLVKSVSFSRPDVAEGMFAGDASIATGAKVSYVSFANGEVAYVPADEAAGPVWRKVLRHAQKPRRRPRPVFAVPKENTRAIERIRLPLLTQVIETKKVGNKRVEVRFERSAGIFTADTSTAAGKENVKRLQAAVGSDKALVVTADDEEDVIIDVHEPDFVVPVDPPCPLGKSDQRIILATEVASLSSARQFFDSVLTEKCRLPRTTDSCLPIQFPDNFCWAIASSICKKLVARQIACGKVFLFGDLLLKTPHRFRCEQRWQFHVAAFVRTSRSTATEDMLVIDPVVSPEGPLPLRDWQQRIEVSVTDRVIADPKIYRMLGRDNGFCESPGDTEEDLGLMRDQLRLRADGRRSPPPYAHCNV
jgi:hypothetical protein